MIIPIDNTTEIQKLRQKSHSYIREMSFGEFAIILSLYPVFSISRIKNADMAAIIIAKAIKLHTSDIVLLLLV